MDWIARLRPPRYLRYFFYIIFMWYQKEELEKNDAHWTAIIFLTIPHVFVFVFLIPAFFFGTYISYNENSIILLFLVILGIHYYLFIYKDKWKEFVKEFHPIDRLKRAYGTIVVLCYLLLLIVFSFCPLIFDIALKK